MRRAAAALGLLLALLAAPRQSAGEGAFQEYQVKAAYLYNFAKFVEWPREAFESPQAPIVIVVLGRNPFGDALAALRNKTANGRPIAVRTAASADEIAPCHLLYVGSSDRAQVARALRAAEGRRILTVSDAEGFAEAGGAVNMVVEGGRVVLEINPEAAQRAHLAVSSKLLAIARIVRGGGR